MMRSGAYRDGSERKLQLYKDRKPGSHHPTSPPVPPFVGVISAVGQRERRSRVTLP